MSKVRRWAHTVTWEGLQISAAYMAINDGGEYVMHDDYVTLEAELAKLRAGQEPVAWAVCREPGKVDALSAAYASESAAKAHVNSYATNGCSGLHVTPLYTAPATVQGDGWIPVSERLPDVEQRLDKPCELEGKSLPPLNITSTVQCFDGKRVFADAIEWFDGGQPMKGVTHWKPLDAAPAAIAAARKGEGE